MIFDSSGNIYVINSLNDRVENLIRQGFQSQFGFWWSRTDSLVFLNNGGENDLLIDDSDNIYIADTGNNRVQKFDSSGNYVSQFGSFQVWVTVNLIHHQRLRLMKTVIYILDATGRVQNLTPLYTFISIGNLSGILVWLLRDDGTLLIVSRDTGAIERYSQYENYLSLSSLNLRHNISLSRICDERWQHELWKWCDFYYVRLWTTFDLHTKPATDISVNGVFECNADRQCLRLNKCSGFWMGTTTSYGNTVNYSPLRNSFNAVINEFINWTVNDIASAYVRYDNKAYTANKSYHSIEMYDALDGKLSNHDFGLGSQGREQSQFEICTSGCQTGISGSGMGSLISRRNCL